MTRRRAVRYASDNPKANVMQEFRPAIPPQLNSRQVLIRAAFRLLLLSCFATFGTRAFGQTLASLLALAAIFCAIVAAVRGEAIFGRTLTHWDEAATYAVLGRLVVTLA
jgi:hypothetical protein